MQTFGLRELLGQLFPDAPPDHSTISARAIDRCRHRRAALCGIVWRDTGESYQDFLTNYQDFLTKLVRFIRGPRTTS
jgi:hypothetical protein